MRYLKRNKAGYGPTNILCLDVETREAGDTLALNRGLQQLHLWAGIACRLEDTRPTRDQWRHGRTRADALDWIESRLNPHRPLWVVSPQLGVALSAICFWEDWEEEHWGTDEPLDRFQRRRQSNPRARRRQGLIVCEEPPVILRLWHRSGSQAVFLDLGNFFPSDLAEIASSVGMPLGEVPRLEDPDGIWLRHLTRRVEVTQAALLSYFRLRLQADLGVQRYTLAGQSLQAYRHRFMDTRILLHDDRDVKRLERDCYYGGRTESYYVGPAGAREVSLRGIPLHWGKCDWEPPRGPISILDANGLYPWVMQQHDYPCRLVGHCPEPGSPPGLQEVLGGRVCGRVLLSTDSALYPVRLGRETLYPVGRFWTHLAGPELSHAQAAGRILDWGEWAVYDTANLFSRYVSELWSLRLDYRQRGLKCWEYLVKVLLNSLYGKWAQRNHRWELQKGVRAPVPWGVFTEGRMGEPGVEVHRAVAWADQLRQPLDPASGLFPAISAWVTSYGRLHMQGLRDLAGPGQVLYQGCDSLHLTPEGYGRIRDQAGIDPDRLGGLKLKDSADSAVYWGPNDYLFGDQLVRAGLKDTSRVTKRGTFAQVVVDRIKSVIAGGPRGGCPWRIDFLPLEQSLPGGQVGPDGWVLPIKAYYQG